jgi:hypothetical protein
MFMPLLCVVLPRVDRGQLAHVVAKGNTTLTFAVRAIILLVTRFKLPNDRGSSIDSAMSTGFV